MTSKGTICRGLFGIVALALLAGCGTTHSMGEATLGGDDPVATVRVMAPVAPMTQGGGRYLVYELVLENVSTSPLTLERVWIVAGRGRGFALEKAPLRRSVWVAGEAGKVEEGPVTLPPSSNAIIYIWQVIRDGEALPSLVGHELTLRQGDVVLPPLRVAATVEDRAPRVFRSPLEGEGWFSANAPAPESPHRRSVQRIDGELWMAQRFAVDFVRIVGPQGTHTGDPAVNASYAAYGAPVMAMADGIVRVVVDGIPENVPGRDSRAVEMSYETLAGNAVTIDHGDGYAATYAHLIPGRVDVVEGQTVKAGDVIGYVGNSGNSTEPHLHLHVCDAASVLACQGVPYAFDRFVEVPIVLSPNDAPRAGEPVQRRREIPQSGAYLILGDVPSRE